MKKPRVDEIRQYELLELEHRTLHPSRLKTHDCVNNEAIYLSEWRRIQREIPHLLGLILRPDDGPTGLFGERQPVIVTRRDANVAATLVMWFATNVGDAFIRRCQKKCDDLRQRQLDVSLKRRRDRGPVWDTRTAVQKRKARLDATRHRLKRVIGEMK